METVETRPVALYQVFLWLIFTMLFTVVIYGLGLRFVGGYKGWNQVALR